MNKLEDKLELAHQQAEKHKGSSDIVSALLSQGVLRVNEAGNYEVMSQQQMDAFSEVASQSKQR